MCVVLIIGESSEKLLPMDFVLSSCVACLYSFYCEGLLIWGEESGRPRRVSEKEIDDRGEKDGWDSFCVLY